MRRIVFILILLGITLLFAGEKYDSESVTTDSTHYVLAKELDLWEAEKMSLILYNESSETDADCTYDIRLYPDRTITDYIYTGTATSDGATLVDTNATFTTNVIGETVYNVTDDSEGTITDTTSTYIYATLSGGTDNAWETGDYYRVTRPQKHYSVGSASLAVGEQDTYELENYYTRLRLFIKKTAAADSTSEVKFSYNLKIDN